MALVVLLKGVNVGGHRRFRPTALARELQELDVVNVGATGTFVVRERIGVAALRAEVARRLPFEAQIVTCRGSEVLELLSNDFFAGTQSRKELVRFVGVLSRAPGSEAPSQVVLPSRGRWLVKVLARHGRFVVGLHRREMRVIGELGRLEETYGAPATIRSWSTMVAIGKVLEGARRLDA